MATRFVFAKDNTVEQRNDIAFIDPDSSGYGYKVEARAVVDGSVNGRVVGYVSRNEAGFSGRQWESEIDGQQYATLRDAAQGAIEKARENALIEQRRRQSYGVKVAIATTCGITVEDLDRLIATF